MKVICSSDMLPVYSYKYLLILLQATEHGVNS